MLDCLMYLAPAIHRKRKMKDRLMEVTLPADLTRQVELELANGNYRSRDELIEQAVRHLFDDRYRGEQRLEALQRIGTAVDQAGLYARVLITSQE
jgi:Arc/MetJ-type ribon-helix-helix transcriptional regulator